MKHRLVAVLALGVLLGATAPAWTEEKKGAMERFGASVDEKVERTKEFFSDAAVTARVKRRLFKDDMVPAKEIRVTVDNGVATLEGDAPSEEIAQRAIDITLATEGVEKVENRLFIVHRTPSKSK